MTRRACAACTAATVAATLVPLPFAAPAAAQVPAAEAEAPAQARGGEELPVVEHTLENGMRFLILPRDGAPTVSFVVHVAVGGVNEVLGSTGTAHLLEHMLFKGTTTVGTRDPAAEERLFARMDAAHDTLLGELARPQHDSLRAEHLRERIAALEDSARSFTVSNELDLIYSRNGARSLNASTSSEATTYYVELPANRAQLWFTLESDRMENPVFREFYAERDVVMEERRTRLEDSASGRLYEAHLATAFQVHPYGVPVIGYMSDLEVLTRGHVEEYYRRFYGPGNTVVAIVGNLDPETILEWADAYFAHLPPGETPPPVLAREPVQRGERQIEVVYDAQPELTIGWHIPDEFHPDMPAVGMLSSILTGGRSSRLYRRLVVDERLAATVSSSSGPGARYPQLFTIGATPRSPHTTGEVEAAIYDELDRLRRDPPDERELQRVRNQLEASRVRRLGSNLGLAFQLAGSASLYGDWRTTFQLAERYQAVQPEDIRRVVEAYFTRENRTVGTVVPVERAPAAPEEGDDDR
ncbi:MAG: pitrilysin family protein [Gemmatimonadota bacterium]